VSVGQAQTCAPDEAREHEPIVSSACFAKAKQASEDIGAVHPFVAPWGSGCGACLHARFHGVAALLSVVADWVEIP
jgi:hypothetical protein